MFNKGIQLPFRLLGIPLILDWSLLIILPWLAWVIGSQAGRMAKLFGLETDPMLTEGFTPYVLGLCAAIGLFVGVVLHELGHAATAKVFGVRTRSIVLWFLGGVARMEEMPRRPGAEALVGIAGPIVSIALAGSCWLVLSAFPEEMVRTRFVLAYLMYMNGVLAVFNLIPALPLDGGRVLRSLLALLVPYGIATWAAGWVSRVLAILLGLFGLLSGNFFLLLIAIFIFMAVTSETSRVRVEELLHDLSVRQLMNPHVSSVRPTTTAGELPALVWRERHTAFPVINEEGGVQGIVSIQDAQNVDPSTPVERLDHPLPMVTEDADAAEAFREMSRNGMTSLAVVDATGRMIGIITKTDLLRAIELRQIQGSSYPVYPQGRARHAYG